MRDDRQSWRKSDLYQVVSEEGVAPSGEVDLENRHAFKALGASLVAQGLKCLPSMRETWVRSLSREDPLEKENGNPLQYSCLENPMEGGAW